MSLGCAHDLRLWKEWILLEDPNTCIPALGLCQRKALSNGVPRAFQLGISVKLIKVALPQLHLQHCRYVGAAACEDPSDGRGATLCWSEQHWRGEVHVKGVQLLSVGWINLTYWQPTVFCNVSESLVNHHWSKTNSSAQPVLRYFKVKWLKTGCTYNSLSVLATWHFFAGLSRGHQRNGEAQLLRLQWRLLSLVQAVVVTGGSKKGRRIQPSIKRHESICCSLLLVWCSVNVEDCSFWSGPMLYCNSCTVKCLEGWYTSTMKSFLALPFHKFPWPASALTSQARLVNPQAALAGRHVKSWNLQDFGLKWSFTPILCSFWKTIIKKHKEALIESSEHWPHKKLLLQSQILALFVGRTWNSLAVSWLNLSGVLFGLSSHL